MVTYGMTTTQALRAAYARIAELERRLAECETEAGRYRFLRDRCNHAGPPTAILFSSDLEPDAAIDRAMEAESD